MKCPVHFQFHSSVPVSFQFLFQFLLRISFVLPGFVLQTFFCGIKVIFFCEKKDCVFFPEKNPWHSLAFFSNQHQRLMVTMVFSESPGDPGHQHLPERRHGSQSPDPFPGSADHGLHPPGPGDGASEPGGS